MKKLITLLIAITTLFSCAQNNQPAQQNQPESVVTAEKYVVINKDESSVLARFNTPEGYKRVTHDSSSFGYYLRHLPLKPYGTPVKYFNGDFKQGEGVFLSVVDMDISNRDLQQCADAVMRLRGEYLYHTKQYDDIHFNFLSDGKPRYYKDYVKGDYSYARFLKYMDYIFAYANTGSLHKELVPADDIENIQAGDVFIQTGNPYGHAVIVLDVAINDEGKKVFMIAQSYMPAQETQVLINPSSDELTPWYEAKAGDIHTPEWPFVSTDLRRFK